MSDSVKKYFERYPGGIKVEIHESPDGGKTVKSRPFREPKKDSYVERVVKKFEQRSQMGIEKYGTTLDRTDVDLLGWLTHLQEELMDAALYVEKLKDEVTEDSKGNTKS